MPEKNICPDCLIPRWRHFINWLEEFVDIFLPQKKFPKNLETFFDFLLENLFVRPGFFQLRTDFTPKNVSWRSFLLLEALKSKHISCWGLKTSFGWANLFKVNLNGKSVFFEGLPFIEPGLDDKWQTKQILAKNGFPVAQGETFWFWQKRRALEFSQRFGFPLVVKPRKGSVSRHVATGIKTVTELQAALNKVLAYSPDFIIERYLPDTFVYRATVIDYNFVAVSQQLPANVIGDGKSTIKQLVEKKNQDPRRGRADQHEFIFAKILINETSEKLLANKNYSWQTILPEKEIFCLQKDSFVRLGGDIIEVSDQVHGENIKMFREIAKTFKARVVGIDFLAKDVSKPWQEQKCAVLELNANPAFETHHFPISGRPQNVAEKIANMFIKYQ